MSLLLERIGAFCARNRGAVAIAWLAVLGAVLALTLSGPKSSDSGFEIPGSESSNALRTLNAQFPETVEKKGAASLQLVFVAPKGQRERVRPAGSVRPPGRFPTAWARFVARRPLVGVLGGTALLCALSIPVLSMSTELLTPGGEDPKNTQRTAYTLVSDAFGAGSQDPLIVLVEGDDAKASASRATVVLGQDPAVASVSPTMANKAGDASYFAVTSRYGPTGPGTGELVDSIRATRTRGGVNAVSRTGLMRQTLVCVGHTAGLAVPRPVCPQAPLDTDGSDIGLAGFDLAAQRLRQTHTGASPDASSP